MITDILITLAAIVAFYFIVGAYGVGKYYKDQ